MSLTDEQIIEAFKEHRSNTLVAKQLGVSISTVYIRLRILRAKGVDLPTALRPFQRGNTAREAGIKGRATRWGNRGQSKSL